MNTEAVKTKLQNYQNALAAVNQYRDDWAKAKDLIFSCLNEIKSTFGLNVKIDIEDKVEGMEFIYFGFGQRSSGLFEVYEKTKLPVIKDGGYLFYTQLYNGKISVLVTVPTIEKYMEALEPKSLEVLRPDELTREKIIGHVISFLDEMTAWEDRDFEHHEIGFKVRENLKSVQTEETLN